MSEPLLSARLRVRSGRGRTILRDVELTVAAGETVGVVGESGSGKSMMARAIMGLLPPGVEAQGHVRYDGVDLLALRERERRRYRGGEIGLVMQDPFTMLNPLLRIGVQVTEGLRGEGGRRLSRERRCAEAVRRLAEVGIRDASYAERLPFELSGGMRQRVGIAAALARNPRLLIADEPSTALDVTTQKEILALLKALQAARGMGLVLITHDLRVATSMCDRICVLYAGSMLEVAPAHALDERPRHPYSLGLLQSEPPLDRRLAALAALPGSVPTPDEVAGECPFAPRCRWVAPECRAGDPPLAPLDDGRLSACVRVAEIAGELQAERARAEADAVGGEPVVDAPTAPPVVAVRELRKSFVRGGRETHALKGVSIEVGEHETVGLVGESGSGKTTLGRCIVGLERASSGTIAVVDRDEPAAGAPRDGGRGGRRAARRRRQQVQMVFQDPYSSLNPVRTIGATLAEAVRARDPRAPQVEQAVQALLERVGLSGDYAQRKPAALSGGERQRVAIARALALRPRLLVFDEAVSALDVSVQAQILNLLRELRAELSVSCLFITHDLAVVRQVADRIYVMQEGEVVESGATEAVLDRPSHPYTQRLIASVPEASASWLPT